MKSPAQTEVPQKTSLSILVPVYNEQHLVAESLGRLRLLEACESLERIEVIVVDDCSKDETPAVLRRFQQSEAEREGCRIEWTFLRQEKNRGKGDAVRTALERATCDVTVIHDADLEYHPRDLLRIVDVFITEKADAVFGSRFAGGEVRRVLMYRHELGNKLLTSLCNAVTNLNLTDMETCYKAVRTRLLKSIPLQSNDFRIEPELTIKLAKRRARIFEVPISYFGRTYQEGKKIGWRDGFAALSAIASFAVDDQVYNEDASGSHILTRLSRASTFHQWLADVVRPHCGQNVLELGCGVGNLTESLIPRRQYTATDSNPHYLDTLETLRVGKPYLRTSHTDITDATSFPTVEGGYDTVICLNVLEHVDNDLEALRNIRRVMAEDSKAIILVPHGPWNFGSLDRELGRNRRYSKESLADLADKAGFEISEQIAWNRFGSPAWFLNGRVLGRKHFGIGQVLTLNAITPLVRRFDENLPFPPLSILAILKPKRSGSASPTP